MCKKNIKDRDYYYDANENEFFCSDCNLQLTKNNVCHVCMTSTTKTGIIWVQCENCTKWIHEHCDK